MDEKAVSRLILKEDDILILYIPTSYFITQRRAIPALYKQIKDKLVESGKKNKIIIIPKDMEIGVIGKDQIKEHISNVDLWHLFEDHDE
jgi:hypothetical protein